LLENGANSSFASASANPDIPVEKLLEFPADDVRAEGATHPKIPLPRDLYGMRKNSAGIEFGHRASLEALQNEIRSTAVIAPAKSASPQEAMNRLAAGFRAWNETPAEARAKALEKTAALIEAKRGALLALLQDEGKKTLDDALAEVREAADFC